MYLSCPTYLYSAAVLCGARLRGQRPSVSDAVRRATRGRIKWRTLSLCRVRAHEGHAEESTIVCDCQGHLPFIFVSGHGEL